MTSMSWKKCHIKKPSRESMTVEDFNCVIYRIPLKCSFYHIIFIAAFFLWLIEHSSVAVEKNITVQNPSNVELTCQFTASGNPNAVNVSWKKDDEPLEHGYFIQAAGRVMYTRYLWVGRTSTRVLMWNHSLNSECFRRLACSPLLSLECCANIQNGIFTEFFLF